jgi:cytochrome c oxidase subunit III
VTEFERVLDLRDLPRDVPGRRASIFAGMVLFIVIEATVIGALLTSYYYYRVMATGGWPPAGIDLPEVVQPMVSLAIILASLGPVLFARVAHRKKQRAAFRSAMALGITLLLVYVGLAFYDLSSLSFDWRAHVYGSIVWTVNGYQLMHVIGLALLAGGIVVLGSPPRGLPRDAAMTVLVLYWTFVVVVSLPSYFTLYLAPHLF